MFRLVGFAAVATAIYVSCYQPSFRDCEISCTAESGCPSGLTCDTNAGRCASHGTCAPNDANDGNSGDVSNACWSFTPTNYAPCEDFPIATDEFAGTVIDTDSTNCSYGSATVCLYHYTKISIVTPVTVTGSRPLILVADGDIDVMSTISHNGVGKSSTSCNAQMVATATALGAGGGGGGYGSNGAAGGAGSGVAAPLGGDSFGSSSLEPLVLGCPGAKGGAGGMAIAVAGGMGGGAIELSSNTMVTIAGGAVVSADGGGGKGGLGVGSANMSGGGGGGAGGSILIEGSMVTVAGMLCAVGGGGAEGGFGSGAQAADGGSGMGCTPGAAGATGIGAGGKGGGSVKPEAGTAAGTVIAGGGGGGGVGRIRIHSISTAQTTGSTSVPAAVVQ